MRSKDNVYGSGGSNEIGDRNHGSSNSQELTRTTNRLRLSPFLPIFFSLPSLSLSLFSFYPLSLSQSRADYTD